MNGDRLASWSIDWLQWWIERSLVAGVVFLVVVPAVLLLARRRWVGAHTASWVLLIPGLVLVLPVEDWLPRRWPSLLPAGVVSWDRVPTEPAMGPESESAPAGESAEGVRSTLDDRFAPATGRSARAEQEFRSLADASGDGRVSAGSGPSDAVPTWGRIRDLGFVVWGLWCVGAIVSLFQRQRRAEIFLRETSDPAAPRDQRLLDECRSQCDLRRSVQLRWSDELASPAAAGLFRPVVYLPRDSAAVLSEQQMRFVLLHELTHVRRLDVLVEGLLRSLRAAFPFHPAAWVTLPLVRRWRELACDEAALARAGSTGRTRSAQALLSLADPARFRGREPIAAAHLLTDGETMKTRIERLLDPARTPRTGLGLRGALTAALLGGVALTAARAQEVVEVGPAPDSRPPKSGAVLSLDDVTDATQVEIEAAIREGTAWLLARQADDGRFGMGVTPKGKPRDHNEAFATGLAIQALLPEADGPNGARVRAAIAKATEWLISTQDDKGRIGGSDPLTMAYGHAQALRALAMVQQRTPSDRLQSAIGSAVTYAEYHRNPYAGWRYEPRSGDNDAKITALMVLALLEAEKAGVEAPDRAVEHGRMTLEGLLDPATGRTGFVGRGEPMSRFVWKNEDFPRKFSEEPTAMHLLVQFECGEDLLETAWMRRALALLVETPPLWSREKGSIDFSYWQYGAEAMQHVDGYQRRLWRDRIATELAAHRVRADGGAYWPAVDAWSTAGMESWTTAAALVALQSLR